MLGSPEFYRIVISIDDVEIRHGRKAPLDTAVNIEIILLGIVLQEGGPEKLSGEIDFDTGIDQKKIILHIGIRKFQEVLFNIYREAPPGLCPLFDAKSILHSGTIIEGPVGTASHQAKKPSLV